jgi:flagellar motor switch protein FliN/FliY
MPSTPFQSHVLETPTTVRVTLAAKRLRVSQILQLVQGAMIQFDKACDEPLSLEVSGRKIATGEAVKVGDKFGLKLRSLESPPPVLKVASQEPSAGRVVTANG